MTRGQSKEPRGAGIPPSAVISPESRCNRVARAVLSSPRGPRTGPPSLRETPAEPALGRRRPSTPRRRRMMRMARWLLFLSPLVGFFAVFFAPRTGVALPLFARKYEMQCTQCHVAFPRLNAFGMQFRQNGYRIGDDKGTSPWETKEFPLSLVGNVGIQYLRNEETPPGGPKVHSSTLQFAQNAVEFHTA